MPKIKVTLTFDVESVADADGAARAWLIHQYGHCEEREPGESLEEVVLDLVDNEMVMHDTAPLAEGGVSLADSTVEVLDA